MVSSIFRKKKNKSKISWPKLLNLPTSRMALADPFPQSPHPITTALVVAARLWRWLLVAVALHWAESHLHLGRNNKKLGWNERFTIFTVIWGFVHIFVAKVIWKNKTLSMFTAPLTTTLSNKWFLGFFPNPTQYKWPIMESYFSSNFWMKSLALAASAAFWISAIGGTSPRHTGGWVEIYAKIARRTL